MELTRRDALAVLASIGVSASTGCLSDSSSLPDGLNPRLLAVAEVVYPDEVETTPEFVETYVLGRVEGQGRDDYLENVAEALDTLDEYTQHFRNEDFGDASPDERDRILRNMGVDTADPDPDGTDAERVRYYVVNELQYALYTSPVGGRLVGIENPIGHPGGTDTYKRGEPSP